MKTSTWTAQLTVASSKAQHYLNSLCTTPKRPPSKSKFYVDFFKKKFFQGSENWDSPSFFRCFAPCPAFLWAEKLSCSVVLPPKNAQTFIGRHFFFTPLISHCLNSQLSKYYGEKTLLGAVKSLEVTFSRVSRGGRHFANVGDVNIYPDLVVARTDDGFLRRKGVRSVYLVT